MSSDHILCKSILPSANDFIIALTKSILNFLPAKSWFNIYTNSVVKDILNAISNVQSLKSVASPEK